MEEDDDDDISDNGSISDKEMKDDNNEQNVNKKDGDDGDDSDDNDSKELDFDEQHELERYAKKLGGVVISYSMNIPIWQLKKTHVTISDWGGSPFAWIPYDKYDANAEVLKRFKNKNKINIQMPKGN